MVGAHRDPRDSSLPGLVPALTNGLDTPALAGARAGYSTNESRAYADSARLVRRVGPSCTPSRPVLHPEPASVAALHRRDGGLGEEHQPTGVVDQLDEVGADAAYDAGVTTAVDEVHQAALAAVGEAAQG